LLLHVLDFSVNLFDESKFRRTLLRRSLHLHSRERRVFGYVAKLLLHLLYFIDDIT
jgi:hypothetical protein